MSFTTFGDCILNLVQKLISCGEAPSKEAAWKRLETLTGYGRSTVHNWGTGSPPPKDATLEILARKGASVGLDRDWGENLVTYGQHSDPKVVLRRFWGLPEANRRSILDNLPPPLKERFIGRRKQLKKLLEHLSFEMGTNIITVTSEGGVGKSALVREAANMCLEASNGLPTEPNVPEFEAIIFVSAQDQRLTEKGIEHVRHSSKTLRQIFAEVAAVLHQPKITHATSRKQAKVARLALGAQKTLLIIDNWETILRPNEQKKVWQFLTSLGAKVKVVITSREILDYATIELPRFSREESHIFINREAEEKKVGDNGNGLIGEKEAEMIFKKVGGVPAAMRYVIGSIADGDILERVLEDLGNPKKDVARYVFRDAISRLKARNDSAFRLLLAMALFEAAPQKEALGYVSNLELITMREALANLTKRSLIVEYTIHCTISPLTREYALYELASCPELEAELRERWVKWYLDYAEKWGGADRMEWVSRYGHIEEEWTNYQEVFEWCADNDLYNEMVTLWSGYFGYSKAGVLEFSSIFGYWDTRLHWLRWLVEAAKKRIPESWSVIIEALSDMAWTLTLIGQPETLAEADILLTEAWNIRARGHLRTQHTVAHNRGVWCVRSATDSSLAEFPQWLDKQYQILRILDEELDPDTMERLYIQTIYWEGIYLYEIGDIEGAERRFREAKERSFKWGWERADTYIQNWLVDIGIRTWDDPEQTGKLLEDGLVVADVSKDQRRIAHYHHSAAQYYFKLEMNKLAQEHAIKALDTFERLAMLREADSVRKLVSDLNNPGEAA